MRWIHGCVTAILMLGVVVLPSSQSFAATAHEVEITSAPPETRDEIIPGDRDGYVWSHGYWGWNGTKHVWYPGYWVAKREGYNWQPDCWEQHGEKWRLARGHFEYDPDYEEADTKTEMLPPEITQVTEISGDVPSVTESERSNKKHSVAPRKRVRIDYGNDRRWLRVIHH